MRWWLLCVVGAMSACAGWPETRVQPVADYAAADKPTVSAAPAYTAGPTTVRTVSPDGATAFVCADGSVVPGDRVVPGSQPAC